MSKYELEVVLDQNDENRILDILQKNEVINWSDVKKGYNLK